MLTSERRTKINNLLLEKKEISVAELVEIFKVSDQTIRRDLNALEKEGVLTRTYGGAIVHESVMSKIGHKTLKSLFVENKTLIAKKCAEYIDDGICIYLDSSTTAHHICDFITDKKITVITNSLSVLSKLSEYKNINLISTGGNFQHTSACFVGRTAMQSLSNYYVDKAFVSCRSLSIEKGLTDGDEQRADIRRLIIQNADKVFLIADHTKFNKVSFVNICGFDNIHYIVVDTQLNERWRKFCKDNRIILHECMKSNE